MVDEQNDAHVEEENNVKEDETNDELNDFDAEYDDENEEDEKLAAPTQQPVNVIIGGKQKKESKKEKKETRLKEVLRTAPPDSREYIQAKMQAENELWTTEVIRKGPVSDDDGVPLRIGKAIYLFNGFLRTEEVLPVIEESFGGGSYLILWKDGKKKYVARESFEIAGAPIATSLERQAYRPRRDFTSKSKELDEVEKIKKEREKLKAEHELKKTEKELKEQEEEWEDYDDFDNYGQRGRRGRGGFTGISPEVAYGSIERAKMQEREQARLEDRNIRQQEKIVAMEAKLDAIQEKETNKPAGTDWGGVLEKVLPSVLAFAGGIKSTIEKAVDKLADTMKPKEDDMAKLGKLADIMEKFTPKQKDKSLETEILVNAMKTANTMQMDAMQKVLKTSTEMLIDNVKKASGYEEPETPAVSIVKEIAGGLKTVISDVVKYNKDKNSQLPPQTNTHVLPPPAQPQAQPQPVVPPQMKIPLQYKETIDRLTPAGANLFEAASAAFGNGEDPTVFAEKTKEIAGEEMTEWLLKAGSIENVEPFASQYGFSQYIGVLKSQPMLHNWINKWLAALPEYYAIEAEPVAPASDVEQPEAGELEE